MIRLATTGLLVAAGLAFVAGSARAEIATPAVGTTVEYRCSGTYEDHYVWNIVEDQGDRLRVEGTADGKPVWAEKEPYTLGLTLALRRDRGDGEGVRTQSYDADDLRDYLALKPGTKVTADVRERRSGAKFEWAYEISVGEFRPIDHPVAGSLEVVKIVEKRWIYRSKYSATMTFDLAPAEGIPISIVYKDPKGTQTCDLSAWTTG